MSYLDTRMKDIYLGVDQSTPNIQHFGILGMKWGIRRYQNEDGTLTEEGKKRYSNVDSYDKEIHNLNKKLEDVNKNGWNSKMLNSYERSFYHNSKDPRLKGYSKKYLNSTNKSMLEEIKSGIKDKINKKEKEKRYFKSNQSKEDLKNLKRLRNFGLGLTALTYLSTKMFKLDLDRPGKATLTAIPALVTLGAGNIARSHEKKIIKANMKD